MHAQQQHELIDEDFLAQFLAEFEVHYGSDSIEIDFDGDWEDGLSDTKDDDDFVSLEVEALPLTIEQAETAPISEVRRFLRRYSLGSNATEDVAREMAAAFIETYNEV